MYFPVAGIEVNPLVPPLVAFVISFVKNYETAVSLEK